MATVTVRNLSEDTHRALRVRAALHGRSTEAEIRDILDKAARPVPAVRIGDALAQLGRRAGLTDEELSVIQNARQKSPAIPIELE